MKTSSAQRTKPKLDRPGSLRQDAEKIFSGRLNRVAMEARALSAEKVERAIHDLQVHQIELELQNEELRRTQDALEAARGRYFDLYNLAPIGYFSLDENGQILEANLTAASLLGLPRSVLVGKYFSRYVAAADCDVYYLHHRRLVKTAEPQAFELRLSKPDGTVFSAFVDVTISLDEGAVAICRLVLSDISARKVAEEKLRESQNLLEAVGRMARIGGWAVQLPHKELTWSDEISIMLDYPTGTIPRLEDVYALYRRSSHKVISTALKACVADGTPFDLELEIRTAKRRDISVRVIGRAVRDASGAVTRIEGALQDITEEKVAMQAQASLETQLRESQKMEAIGTLAAGIAHDFNNILGTILGNATLARKDCGWNHQALESLDEIQKAGRRAQDLINQILSFSRRQPTTRRVVSLQPIVEESVRLMRAVLQGGVRLDCQCSIDAPTVLANPAQLKQVLLNLGTNAAHAMREQTGEICVRVESFTQQIFSQKNGFSLRPGCYARIVFSDTGHGMSASTKNRIFEPFFTTKPVGEGTGLGLAVVHGIMQSHEGAIFVSSEVGKGSKFELYFPTASASADALSPHEVASTVSEGAGQIILYLDDDESQLFMFKRMLEWWGYRVIAYREQLEAIEAVRNGEISFDLMITDYKMPGISGLEVARAVRDVRPNLPVLMVSGYINDHLRSQATAAGVRELFSKPHEEEDLRDAIQELLPPPPEAIHPS